MTSEFIRLTKELSNISEKTKDQRLESFGWHFETDRNFEKISVKIEIIKFREHENFWFYISKDEMEATENILNNWMNTINHNPKNFKIPVFTNKRDLVWWLEGREFVEITIHNIEDNKFKVIFDLYEDELVCYWVGDYKELNKILNSLCDLYLINIKEDTHD